MSTTLPPIPPTIAQLTGPLLLGHFFNWGLFGILTVQAYIYYISFPKDRLLPKILVSTTFTIEVLQTVLSTRDAFRNFGTGWGNLIDLDAVGWLWFSVPVLGSIICSTAQIFFGWRVWVLSGKLYIPTAISLLSLIQLGFGIYSGVKSHLIGDFSQVQIHTFRTTPVWLGSAALCDVIIAISMVYYLSRSRTGFRATDVLLTRLVRLMVETGLACATFAVLDLALFVSFEHNNYHLAPSIALSKLYANSLLVVLNARVRIVGGRNIVEQSMDNTLSFVTRSSATATSGYQMHKSARPTNNTLGVAVSQEATDDTYRIPSMGETRQFITPYPTAAAEDKYDVSVLA